MTNEAVGPDGPTLVEPNYCCECKHCTARFAVRDAGDKSYCKIASIEDKTHVAREVLMICGSARSIWAMKPTAFDPVPHCPKWEAR